MDSHLNVSNGTIAGGKLKIFSLHLDFPASIRARQAASNIIKLAGAHWICSSEMWKLESLQSSSSIRKMITGEAARADILLISVSSLHRRELDLIQWLESLGTISANHPAPSLLIGLFGDETETAPELDWTVKHFMSCARNTNRNFIWHWMEEGSLGEPDWLASHLETFLTRKLLAKENDYSPEPKVEFA